MSSPNPTPFQSALLIVNSIAGRGRALAAAEELRAGLEALGIATALHPTRARGDAREHLRALATPPDLVVAVGGDGTVREVLDGLPDPRIPVLICPLGTANVMSLDLGLPREPARLVELVRTGRRAALDVARVDGKALTFLVTGIGIDGAVAQALEELRRGPITKRTWVRAGLRALLRWREPRLEVELDGQQLPGSYGWVLFSNVVHYGGLKFMSADRALDDGLFEAYLFRRCSRLGLLGHFLRGLLRGWPGGGCERRRARRIVVRSPEPVPYEVDGDFGGTTPVAIEILAQRFTLLVP